MLSDSHLNTSIPEDARRLSATGRKCRCDRAEVLNVWEVDAKTGSLIETKEDAYSKYNGAFVYKAGETVIPDSFNEDRWNECSGGIHFFINSQEAIDYEL